jgi:5-methylcytosine-specific restriction endonuclease McrA
MNRYDHKYYLSSIWKKLRDLKILWANNKCEKCGSPKKLQVHHKHYKTFKNEMPWDLVVLCEDCHKDIHYIGKPDSEEIVR